MLKRTFLVAVAAAASAAIAYQVRKHASSLGSGGPYVTVDSDTSSALEQLRVVAEELEDFERTWYHNLLDE